MSEQTTSKTSEGRRPRRLWALLLLNGVLLMALAAVTFSPQAGAQARPRGDYLMVSGGVAGTNAGVVYVADTVSEELIAVAYDTNGKVIEGIGYRNLAADANTLTRGRAN